MNRTPIPAGALTVDDGTRCALYDSGNYAGGITCNWSDATTTTLGGGS